jgi:WD40 repeat protein
MIVETNTVSKLFAAVLTRRKLGDNQPVDLLFAVGGLLAKTEERLDPETLNAVRELDEFHQSLYAPPVLPTHDRYADQKWVGSGGMGHVYRVHDSKLNRTVILKRMRRSGQNRQASLKKSFLREIEVTAKLNHPNIIRLYDTGELDGLPFYTMPEIPGKSLAQLIRTSKYPHSGQLRLLLELFRTLCGAIGHAHDQGYAHCDLKPDNIKIGVTNEIVVIDWGLAREFGTQLPAIPFASDTPLDELLERTQVFGTWSYMPPEQFDSPSIAGRVLDVYALGAILFEILAGEPPFKGNHAEIVAQKRKCDLGSHLRDRRRFPRSLASVCTKAMQQDPSSRYQNAMELRDEVGRWLDFRRVSAHSESVRERLTRAVLRHRRWLVPIAGSLVLITGVSVAASAYLSQAWHEASDALADKNAALIRETAERTEKETALGLEYRARVEAISRLARQHMTDGDRELLAGHGYQALPYYVEALRLDAERELFHRTRLKWLLQQYPSVATICSHDAPILYATLSYDDKWLMTTDRLGTVRIWDANTGKRKGELKHDGPVRHGSFSENGRQVVTVGEDKTARIWDWETGRIVIISLKESGQLAWFSPDSSRVITIEGNVVVKNIKLWEAMNGAPIGPPILTLDKDVAYRKCLSKDRNKVAIVAGGVPSPNLAVSLFVCDIKNEKNIRINPGILWSVSDMRFTPDDEWLLVVGQGQIFAWNTTTGQPGAIQESENGALKIVSVVGQAKPLLESQKSLGEVSFAALNPSYSVLATTIVNETRVMRLKPLPDQDVVNVLLESDVKTCLFSPNGRALLTVSCESYTGSARTAQPVSRTRYEAQLWDPTTGFPMTPPLVHRGPITAVVFSQDGSRLVTAGEDGAAIIWALQDRSAGKQLSEHIPGRHNRVVCHEMTQDGHLLISVERSDLPKRGKAQTQLINVNMNESNPQQRIVWKGSANNSFCVSQNCLFGSRVMGKRVEVIDLSTGMIHRPFGEDKSNDEIMWSDIDMTGRRAITHSKQCVSLWSIGGEPPVRWTLGMEIQEARLSPDGRWVVVVGSDGKLLVRDFQGGVVRTWQANGERPISLGSFSSNNKFLTICIEGTSIVILDLDSITAKQLTLPAKSKEMKFSPDGSMLATSCSDGTVHLWDVQIGVPLVRPLVHSSSVKYMEFSEDGRWLVTVTEYNFVQIWEAVTGTPLTAPLRQANAVEKASFRSRTNELLVVCRHPNNDDGVQLLSWVIGKDDRSNDDLAHHAALLAGFEIDKAGALHFLDGPTRHRLWETLRLTSSTDH